MAYVPIVPYADLEFADGYFGERLGSEAWDVLDNNTKAKALKHATKYIDTLPFIGTKTDTTLDEDKRPNQPREFPREGYTEIPDEVMEATCEAALAILNGDTLENLQTQAEVTSTSTGDASSSFDTTNRKIDINDGLISAMVLRLLHEWLIDPNVVRLERV